MIALDLDGTLTQHRSPLEETNRHVLDMLRSRYSLVVVGAGACQRIHRQMGGYPVNIIGNYGMEISRYDSLTGKLEICECHVAKPDRTSVIKRANEIRREFGYTKYTGESVEFYDSGMITFPLLGKGADIGEKLAFDPNREKRRSIYSSVVGIFPEYTVFIGGTSSFDLVPAPFEKRFALEKYCRSQEIDPTEAVFFGDDWEPGGGDRQVYISSIPFVIVDNYQNFSRAAHFLLE